jgi:hypothetical protein
VGTRKMRARERFGEAHHSFELPRFALTFLMLAARRNFLLRTTERVR